MIVSLEFAIALGFALPLSAAAFVVARFVFTAAPIQPRVVALLRDEATRRGVGEAIIATISVSQ